MPDAVVAVVALGAIALGFLVGRFTAGSTRRLGELQGRVEELSKEREFLQAEVAAAKDAAKQLREEQETYRGQVAEHFTGASELLRDMTRQYRAIYDHMTRGAGALCPEGFVGLEPGSGPDALPPGDEPEEAAGETPQGEAGSEAAAPSEGEERSSG